ncbi:hypothetical protein IFM89_021856 [Coptis chinensis]|uniref:DUF7755 domain-containing protein n=2 Tax=Coptis chinensis TaxID=261450 RepID=A0A835HEN7_9MAGN|nr:hypothetical protein IFM89_021856 [Coptis chinensis]
MTVSTLAFVVPTSCSTRWHEPIGRICPRIRKPSLVRFSKPSDYQDFQNYVKPLRLLPATEPNICTHSTVEEMCVSLEWHSQSVYVVRIYTSSAFGSGLTDSRAAILICLIDENGDSILQRISTTLVGTSLDGSLPEHCFQRGSVDEFIFKGPKLGRVQAFWVGLDSGRWRLGGVSLIVVYGYKDLPVGTEENSRVNLISGLEYGFEADDIPVGEGECMSMVELRPSLITEISGADILSSLNKGLSQSTTPFNREVSNEESMEEYADLKSSILIYDSMLIFGGTLIAAISTGEKSALAFLTGGAGGFLYLLLLQNSVDGLPAPASTTMNKEGKNINQLVKRLRGPISSLGFAIVLAGAALKYTSGASPIALTPQEILLGMTGFLACKVAVLLAAFIPMELKLKEME